MNWTFEEHVQEPFTAMGVPTFVEETLDEFWTDAQPLLTTHWAEIAAHADIALSVDREAYQKAADGGTLCIIAARIGGTLVGYAVFFVTRHPHYSGSLQAHEDVIYLHPTLRQNGIGTLLLQASERLLRAKGCQLVHHHVKLAHPALGIMLARHGYEAVETIFSKRLDREE